MAEPNWGDAEAQLKQKSGANYDPTMLEDLKRNASYGAGTGVSNVDNWIDRISNKANLKSSNESGSTYQANGTGGQTIGATGNVNAPYQQVRAAGTSFGQPNANFNTPNVNGNANPLVGNAGGFGSSASGAWSNPQTSQRSDQLFQMLMGRAQQGLGVNANDPVIASQVGAYRADQTRQNRNYVDQLAESGGPTANLSAEKRMAAEHSAQAGGQLQAQLMQNELGNKRQEIASALTSMGSMLSDQQRADLQQQINLIDANLRQQTLNSGNDQWLQEFGLRKSNQEWLHDPRNAPQG